jgi:preprotein translocase subunit SecE
MGFNPFRQQQRRTGDYVLLVAAFVVVAALVLWGLFG